jgi:glycosyltransferase involved in cell wall biosynthesis
MNKVHKFTVVIPVYNSENTISETIESVLNQTYKANQIITVDDGSTDKSAELIKNLQDKHSEIEYYYQPNRGVSTARNLGISKAKNDYIFFLDADDLWLSRKIQLHKEHLDIHPECMASFTDFFIFNQSHFNEITRNIYKNALPLNSHNLSLGICRINGSSSSLLGVKKLLVETGGFNQNLKFGEDLDLWVRLAKKSIICEISEIVVAIRTDETKLKRIKSKREWKLSELYFYIWESNKINLDDKNSKKAARKILHVDLRRNLLNPKNVLFNFPIYFKNKAEKNFNLIYNNFLCFYSYFFMDFLSDLWKIFKNRVC